MVTTTDERPTQVIMDAGEAPLLRLKVLRSSTGNSKRIDCAVFVNGRWATTGMLVMDAAEWAVMQEAVQGRAVILVEQ